jgi:hypothetical protein
MHAATFNLQLHPDQSLLDSIRGPNRIKILLRNVVEGIKSRFQNIRVRAVGEDL